MLIDVTSVHTLVQQRAAAVADFSPDGGLPEHLHHIDRRGMGGRSQVRSCQDVGLQRSGSLASCVTCCANSGYSADHPFADKEASQFETPPFFSTPI